MYIFKLFFTIEFKSNIKNSYRVKCIIWNYLNGKFNKNKREHAHVSVRQSHPQSIEIITNIEV